MGINNLYSLVKKCAVKKNIANYNGMILGIDTDLMIYKLIYAIRRNGYDIKNKDIVITHIHAFLLRLMGFRNNNIYPIFVFDGSIPKIKEESMKTRFENINTYKASLLEKLNSADILRDKIEHDNIKNRYFMLEKHITRTEIDDIKQMIILFGYTYIDAPYEADTLLATLFHIKYIDGVISDDMDMLGFGVNLLIKNFSTLMKKNKIIELDLKNILDTLDIQNYDQFLDICMLLGNDYINGLDGVGTSNSMKLVKKYNTIENMCANNIIHDKLFCNSYMDVKKYYKLEHNVDNLLLIKKYKHILKDYKKTTKEIDVPGLKKFLLSFSYDDEKIDKIMDKLKK